MAIKNTCNHMGIIDIRDLTYDLLVSEKWTPEALEDNLLRVVKEAEKDLHAELHVLKNRCNAKAPEGSTFFRAFTHEEVQEKVEGLQERLQLVDKAKSVLERRIKELNEENK